MKVVKLRRNPRDEYSIVVPKEIGTELSERGMEYFTFGVTEYGTLQYTPINSEAI
jgi:hypothetical protein